MNKFINLIYRIVTGFHIHTNKSNLCQWRKAVYMDDNIE